MMYLEAPVSVLISKCKHLITGLYPGDHNIIGNQFADVDPNVDNGKMYFDKANEHYTGLHKWWHSNEPIWASASKAGLNFSTFLWSRYIWTLFE